MEGGGKLKVSIKAVIVYFFTLNSYRNKLFSVRYISRLGFISFIVLFIYYLRAVINHVKFYVSTPNTFGEG